MSLLDEKRPELEAQRKDRLEWIRLGAADLAVSIRGVLGKDEHPATKLIRIAAIVDDALKGVTVHSCTAEDMGPGGMP